MPTTQPPKTITRQWVIDNLAHLPTKKRNRKVCELVGHSDYVFITLGLVQCVRCKEVFFDYLENPIKACGCKPPKEGYRCYRELGRKQWMGSIYVSKEVVKKAHGS